jgi:cyclohexanone monooxygenase
MSNQPPTGPEHPTLESIRDKYRHERDRRVRSDGSNQFIELDGEFARFRDDDPYVEAGFTRDPITDEIDVAIIGGGFSGLLAAARLSQQGVTSFRIVEAGGDFGGTWYWNRYPGAQCDTEAYLYLPLLEELGYMPKEKYAYVTEIFEHTQRIGHHFGLYEKTHFQTRVRSLSFDSAIDRWHIATNRDDDIKARFVVMAIGPMTTAKLPGIPGISDFKGHSFHTSRWDYEYTGGDTTGGLDKLADKTVAIIGTGATGVQCIPRVAQYAKHLYVFQRTPSTVDWRRNAPTDPSWWASLEPGWQRDRRNNFNDIASGRPVDVDLVDDGWTSIFRSISSPKGENRPRTKEERDHVVELSDFAKMEELRGRVGAVVDDRATAEALKPYYRVMCKRPTFNDEFLECFNRPNVTLVDVADSKGVEQITAHGIVANGAEYDVDCIVFASGFATFTEFKRRVAFDITGRDGQSLFDYWSDGQKTLHGFMTRGFPNWFYIGVSQNAFSVNMTSMFDEQARHIAYIVAETMKRDASTVEPSERGQSEWVGLINSFRTGGIEFLQACTPGYYNNEGHPMSGNAFLGAYTPGINRFNDLLEQWRDAGDMDGLELKSR